MDERWLSSRLRGGGRRCLAVGCSAPFNLRFAQSRTSCVVADAPPLASLALEINTARASTLVGVFGWLCLPWIVLYRCLDDGLWRLHLWGLPRHCGLDLGEHLLVEVPFAALSVGHLAHIGREHRRIDGVVADLQPVGIITTCRIPHR